MANMNPLLWKSCGFFVIDIMKAAILLSWSLPTNLDLWGTIDHCKCYLKLGLFLGSIYCNSFLTEIDEAQIFTELFQTVESLFSKQVNVSALVHNRTSSLFMFTSRPHGFSTWLGTPLCNYSTLIVTLCTKSCPCTASWLNIWKSG